MHKILDNQHLIENHQHLAESFAINQNNSQINYSNF